MSVRKDVTARDSSLAPPHDEHAFVRVRSVSWQDTAFRAQPYPCNARTDG
jgi:hypothetical protein